MNFNRQDKKNSTPITQKNLGVKNERTQGKVSATFGRHCEVELSTGILKKAFPKGKRIQVCVGDEVYLELVGKNEALLIEVLPRKNLFFRSDGTRTKQFAANIDVLLIVVATEPPFSQELVTRALVGAHSVGVSPIILLNKIDLSARLSQAKQQLTFFEELGIPILYASVKQKPEAITNLLHPYLNQKITLLLGQSGMGKSSLLNTLIPGVTAATQEHSQALQSGKHTTTATRLYHLPSGNGSIIDSPGFQAFGLAHLNKHQIEQGFPEFSSYLDSCKFYNCSHLHEPGCGILKALDNKKIHEHRYLLFKNLIQQIASSKNKN